MSANPASDYGVDIACVSDADELFSGVVGLGAVVQDAVHRLTTDHVLGPGGDGWGYDCRRLIGLPAAKLAAVQPTLAEVLTRDERVDTADVVLTATTTRGLADVVLDVRLSTAFGPFRFVKSVLDLTNSDLEEQAA